MKKVLLTLIFSCFAMLSVSSVFAAELVEKPDVSISNYLDNVSVVNPVYRCFYVSLSCWEDPQLTCFDESYTEAEIRELIDLMDDTWCEPIEP